MSNHLIDPDIKEEWRDVVGYEGYYQVSNFGQVRSLGRYYNSKGGSLAFKRGRLRKLSFRKDGKLPDGSDNGYLGVVLCKDKVSRYVEVHRLVAQAFIDNPENKLEVNHINGIKNDNYVGNLEWVTHSENLNHAIRTGLKKKYPEKSRLAGMYAKPILSKPVLCVTTNTIYESRKSASDNLGIPRATVFDSLRDGKPHRGYLFKEIAND